MNAPILICGCPGSGTSLVTKILRHAGLFVGADAGPADARKYHESQGFKHYNIQFLSQTIDFPHAPKSVNQFQTHNARMLQEHGRLADLVNRDQLFSGYCGGSTSLPLNQPWGWKDPRNSATAMIWQDVFPGLRVIAISRTWRWRDRFKSGGSESGNWYRKKSTAELRALYENPIGFDSNSIFRVDVDQLITDADCLGQLLAWCSLSCLPRNDYVNFMAKIGVER